MRLRKFAAPTVCDRRNCTKLATAHCSMLDDRATVCESHIQTLERLWGQVYVKRGVR